MDHSDLTQSRITFLHSDLDIANTFVKLAKTELDLKDREHSDALLDKARTALETVRRLMAAAPKIESGEAEKLAKRCDELESSIQSLRPSTHK